MSNKLAEIKFEMHGKLIGFYKIYFGFILFIYGVYGQVSGRIDWLLWNNHSNPTGEIFSSIKLPTLQ